MYDYQLIALLLVLWTQPGDKTKATWLAGVLLRRMACSRKNESPIKK
jgi:hypothetical protein